MNNQMESDEHIIQLLKKCSQKMSNFNVNKEN